MKNDFPILRTPARTRGILSIALILAGTWMIGCGAPPESGDEPVTFEFVNGELVGPAAVSGCTVSAARPWTDWRTDQYGQRWWAVIGSATVSNCSVNTTISVKATLRNETTGRNGYWTKTCYNSKFCSVEVWLSHSSGRWYTEGNSDQASPSYAKSTWADL